MRTTYLVCYDVADDKRLRKVFKTCGNFGDHLQFSVFECDLNPSEKIELETALSDIINHDEDQVIFVALGPSEGRGDRVITALGLPPITATVLFAVNSFPRLRERGPLWSRLGRRDALPYFLITSLNPFDAARLFP